MEAKDLVDHLLEASIEGRYSAFQALNHPWILKHSPPPDVGLNHEMEESDEELEFQERLREAMNRKKQETLKEVDSNT